jgi:hypothetical protein
MICYFQIQSVAIVTFGYAKSSQAHPNVYVLLQVDFTKEYTEEHDSQEKEYHQAYKQKHIIYVC